MTPEEHRAEAERLVATWSQDKDAEVVEKSLAAVSGLSVADACALGLVRMTSSANLLAAAAIHAQLAGPPPIEPEQRRFFYLRTAEGKVAHEAAMRGMQARLMGLAR